MFKRCNVFICMTCKMETRLGQYSTLTKAVYIFLGGDFSPICASCVGEEYLKCFLAIALQCSQQTLGSSTAQHYVLVLGAVEVQVDFFLSTS